VLSAAQDWTHQPEAATAGAHLGSEPRQIPDSISEEWLGGAEKLGHHDLSNFSGCGGVSVLVE